MASQDRHPESPGLQAYRVWVAVASAGCAALCGLIYSTVRETSNDVATLKVDMGQIKITQGHQNSRIERVELRNDQQDERLAKFQEEFWKAINRLTFSPPPVPTPPPPPPFPPPAPAVVPSTPSLRVYP